MRSDPPAEEADPGGPADAPAPGATHIGAVAYSGAMPRPLMVVYTNRPESALADSAVGARLTLATIAAAQALLPEYAGAPNDDPAAMCVRAVAAAAAINVAVVHKPPAGAAWRCSIACGVARVGAGAGADAFDFAALAGWLGSVSAAPIMIAAEVALDPPTVRRAAVSVAADEAANEMVNHLRQLGGTLAAQYAP